MNAQVLEIEAKGARPIGASFPTANPPSDSFITGLETEDQVLLTKLLTEPMDFVDHPEFVDGDIERRLFGGSSRLVDPRSTRFMERPDTLVDAAAGGERVPTLSYAEEAHVFMRFNFARRQIVEILRNSAGKRLTAPVTRLLLAWGHRMLAARSVIVRLNMPLVLAMAKRTRLSNIDFNELISEGNMALLRSVEKFDCGRGYKFSTYSCRAILKSFSRVAMRASRYRGTFPAEFNPAMERSDYVDRMRQDVAIDCVDELKEIFLRNLAGLSDVERTVIAERFALGPIAGIRPATPKTLEQVGTLIGVTKERVRQIQNNALKKMRVALESRFLAA
jgi:RNA polymerase sigma factor (sigma-70 family)